NLIGAHFAGKLPATVAGGFNLVDVLDVVDGAIAAQARGKTGESYILGGRWYTVRELLDVARALTGRGRPLFDIPLWLARGALPAVELAARLTRTRPLYNLEELNQLAGNPDIRSDKARSELGYAPRPIDDALRRIHAWLGH